MLDIKSHSQLAEATADMMRACAFATARAASTSMFQGMSFWSRMLRPAPVFPAAWAMQSHASSTPADGGASNCVCTTQPDAQTEDVSLQAAAETPAEAGFSSYRSPSGHAVAQVIVPEAT